MCVYVRECYVDVMYMLSVGYRVFWIKRYKNNVFNSLKQTFKKLIKSIVVLIINRYETTNVPV